MRIEQSTVEDAATINWHVLGADVIRSRWKLFPDRALDQSNRRRLRAAIRHTWKTVVWSLWAWRVALGGKTGRISQAHMRADARVEQQLSQTAVNYDGIILWGFKDGVRED